MKITNHNTYEAQISMQGKFIKSQKSVIVCAECKIDASKILGQKFEDLANKLNKRQKGFASVFVFDRSVVLHYLSKTGHNFSIFIDIL